MMLPALFFQRVLAGQAKRKQNKRTVYPVELYRAMSESRRHPDQLKNFLAGY